ncbi:hypothetical protein F5888DRAFT_1667675 [Russula emetica]|nr:hypothetical protein F5888DRAFT_1667675 [Russula emetica]
MLRYCIVSGITLILLIIDFAIAAPVLVQEKRQVGVNLVQMPEDAITMLRKRGDDFNKIFLVYEDHFAKPEESSAARPSSSSPPSEPDHGWTNVEHPPPSIPEKSPTMSDADYEIVEADALPNPGPSTVSGHEHGLPVEEPLSRPALPTEDDADDEYEVVHPPPPTESDHVVEDVPPSSPVSSTRPDRRSMAADSRLENHQAVSDALKDNAKESRRISGTARDVLNAA